MSKLTDLLLLIMAATVIYYRYETIKISAPNNDIPYQFSAQLVQLPTTHTNYQTFKLGQVFVTTRYPPEYSYGDYLTVEGTLTTKMQMKYPKITAEAPGMTSLQKNLLNLRERLSAQIANNLPSPEAELVAGVLWGEKANLPKDFSGVLKRSGVMHLVVVSGYNISVIAALMLGAFAVLGRKASAVATILGLVVFTLLTGAEAPSVRAAIMGGLMVLGNLMGRERTALRLLIISAIVMLIVNPLWAEDLGFQLSFLATVGILLFAGQSGKLEMRIQKGVMKAENRKEKFLSSVIRFLTSQPELRTTLAAQVLTWPLIATAFGTVSLVSPVTNVLVGWTVPIMMGLGALLTVVSSVSSILAQAISLVLLVPAKFFVGTVEHLAQVPYATMNLGVEKEFLVIYYLAVAAVVFHPKVSEIFRMIRKTGRV